MALRTSVVLFLVCVLSANATVPVALNGFDIIQCASLNGTSPCHAVGTTEHSTKYSSLDRDGSPRFITEFRFVSESNMIAFENSPFSYTPKFGGFCAWTLSNWNRSDVWSRDKLGPPSDLLNSWRVVKNPLTGLEALYLFGDEPGAERFLAGLPETAARADQVWNKWWGKHGAEPPYAIDGGPFNSECFTRGGNDTRRDCAEKSQPLPPPPRLTNMLSVDNNKPKLDTHGNIVNAHDGLYSFSDGYW
eukprot:gene21615-8321_t